jgi:phosphoglycerate dehydrogenase-like enzyme
VSVSQPGIAIAPRAEPAVAEAVVEAGGRVVAPAEADGVVWTVPSDPGGLRSLLRSSPATWVQLPFAGIESFVDAGVVDSTRTWTCAKGAYGHATAEHALALMLAASRRLHHHARDRRWIPRGDRASPERRLRDATVLVVGTGGVGGSLAAMLAPIGARLVAVNRSARSLQGADRTEPMARLPDVLGEADFVVLAAPLTSSTRGLFDRVLLGRMRAHAWLVNVARGGLVVTDDLVDALRAKEIGGAALDVTDPEPLPPDHPLWSMDEVLLTPHVANTWDMALPELAALVRRNVASFAAGASLEGRVDPTTGY